MICDVLQRMTWQPLADVALAGPADGGVTEDTQVMERRRRLHTGATAKTHRRHIQVRSGVLTE